MCSLMNRNIYIYETYLFGVMKLKIRKSNLDGNVRLETSGNIKEIMINEDFFNPKHESIAIGFKGKSSSGIIELSSEEVEVLYSEIKKKKHLIKGIKILN